MVSLIVLKSRPIKKKRLSQKMIVVAEKLQIVSFRQILFFLNAKLLRHKAAKTSFSLCLGDFATLRSNCSYKLKVIFGSK